jgi:ubiquinone/menaquinone biosynthesis C-methylase UbiE
MARQQGKATGTPLDLLQGSAQAIPLDDASVDTVTMTWTLCSIPNASQALVEIRRVLKPSGSLLFVEHGAAPDPGVAAWQNRLTPFWRRIAGGCRLNRDVAGLLRTAGFEIVELHQGYMRGPRPFTFMSEGRARPS